MKNDTSYQEWQPDRIDFYRTAIMAGIVAFFVLTVASNNFMVGAAGTVAIIALFDLAYKPFKRTAVYKFFLTTWPVAAQIVENVLQAKGLPYQRIAEEFIVDDITIRVKTGVYGKNGPRGVFVQIGPYQGDNVALIRSLREKLDEAFAPQGIRQEHDELSLFNL